MNKQIELFKQRCINSVKLAFYDDGESSHCLTIDILKTRRELIRAGFEPELVEVSFRERVTGDFHEVMVRGIKDAVAVVQSVQREIEKIGA